jgi:hypothetical protein
MRKPMQRPRWLDALIILLALIAMAFVAQMVWGLLSRFSGNSAARGYAELIHLTACAPSLTLPYRRRIIFMSELSDIGL